MKKYIRLYLLVLLFAHIIVAPVIASVVVTRIVDAGTHLLFLGVVLAVIYHGSGGSSGSRSRSTTHLVLCELCFFAAGCCM